jgi:hypothetical protein
MGASLLTSKSLLASALENATMVICEKANSGGLGWQGISDRVLFSINRFGVVKMGSK